MPFTTHLSTQGDTVTIALEGDLDSATAPRFRAAVDEATGLRPGRLVLEMTHLAYLSSAGLRGLVFARQKMPDGTELVLVGANPAVTETIRLTGFDHSVTFGDTVPE
jgi:anti-anti-sigma factor